MAYPENEGREVWFNESRNAAFYRLRGRYSQELESILQSSFGENLLTAERLFSIYLKRGHVPHPSHLLDKVGNVEPELSFGIALLTSKELVKSKLAAIERVLEAGVEENVALPITDDLPQFTTLMRGMFPVEVDGEIMSICNNGLRDGWNTVLNLLGSQDVPLAMFPKSLGPHLRRKTTELYPHTSGIVLPTAIAGVQAHYDYTSEFVLPYVSLTIEPSKAA